MLSISWACVTSSTSVLFHWIGALGLFGFNNLTLIFMHNFAFGILVYGVDFSPSPVATDGEAANPGPRERRRGPRSEHAISRRRSRWSDINAHNKDAIPTIEAVIDDQRFTIWHTNAQGLLSSLDELTARLRLAATKPDIICINESWLDKSVKSVELEGYTVVARRDRRDGRECGGVLVFAEKSVASSITQLSESEQFERVWLMIHANTGPHLLGAWYRPPASGERESISSLPAELAPLRDQVVGTTIIGDVNVHQRQWLRHSARNSTEGSALQSQCRSLGLQQIVRGPTRGEHLLDVVLTDSASAIATTEPAIADHKLVKVVLELDAPKASAHSRKVWQFKDADWDLFAEALTDARWDDLDTASPSEGAELLTRLILECAERAIPTREMEIKASTHPWMNDIALGAVAAKQAAAGSHHAAATAKACSKTIAKEYNKYVARTEAKLRGMKAGSKRWWAQTRRLLKQSEKGCNVPALRRSNGEWVRDNVGKGKLFEDTFSAKFVIPAAVTNSFSALEIVDEDDLRKIFVIPPEEHIAKVLANLDENSSTGPDVIPARVLKRLAHVLARALRNC